MSLGKDDPTVDESTGPVRPADAPPGLHPTGAPPPVSEATPVERTGGASRSGGSTFGTEARTGSTRGTSTLTSHLALREEQAERARPMLAVAVVVSTLTLVAFQLPGVSGGPGEIPATVGLVVLVAYSVSLLAIFRPPKLIGERPMLVFALLVAYAINSAVLHVGVFTPAIMASFVVVYYFATGDSPLGAWGMFLSTSVGYAVLAAIFLFWPTGMVARESIFVLENPHPVAMSALTVVVEMTLGLTFWLGQRSRKATLEAMSRLERAREQIRQREALLNEARADFERVLDANKIGRFTGRAVGTHLAEDIIGRGAMGEVYRARHLDSDEPAALKMLPPHALDNPLHQERMFREAKISSSLNSKHIVRVFDSGTAEDGSPYLVMELLTGHDLAHYLREGKRLRLSDAGKLVAQVAAGLAVAEEAGIVHRDLKPGNLFLAQQGAQHVWKILDFGVSKASDQSASLTRGAAVGTPSYMSPEQTKGAEVDHRSDVFALGTITYRTLTGRPPFTGSDMVATINNVANRQPTQPSSIVTLPVDVERVLALALAKRPADRFGSAAIFAAAFREASKNELSQGLRDAADALVERHPWGTERGAR